VPPMSLHVSPNIPVSFSVPPMSLHVSPNIPVSLRVSPLSLRVSPLSLCASPASPHPVPSSLSPLSTAPSPANPPQPPPARYRCHPPATPSATSTASPCPRRRHRATTAVTGCHRIHRQEPQRTPKCGYQESSSLSWSPWGPRAASTSTPASSPTCGDTSSPRGHQNGWRVSLNLLPGTPKDPKMRISGIPVTLLVTVGILGSHRQRSGLVTHRWGHKKPLGTPKWVPGVTESAARNPKGPQNADIRDPCNSSCHRGDLGEPPPALWPCHPPVTQEALGDTKMGAGCR